MTCCRKQFDESTRRSSKAITLAVRHQATEVSDALWFAFSRVGLPHDVPIHEASALVNLTREATLIANTRQPVQQER